MKIDFKKPRYIIPTIFLPFLLIFFGIYKTSFSEEKPTNVATDSLQVGLAVVSDQVKNEALTNKLDAFRKQYKNSDGYTAVNTIAEEGKENSDIKSSYNDREKRVLDSIDKAMKIKYGLSNAPANTLSNHDFPTASVSEPRARSFDKQDKALAEAISKMNRPTTPQELRSPAQKQVDPMQLFRQQMALADSISKSNDPEYKAEIVRKNKVEIAERENREKKRLPVVKADASSALFNTIRAEKDETFITAIVDQDITGYAGSRLRIRLLEDMMAGHYLIKRGTYLYAEISGFTGQRVNLKISTIMQGKNLLPVHLLIYDNDGLPGFYVPASAFREFTKELGGDAGQGLTIQQQAETNNQMVMSVVQKMFQSTTTAVGKLIRQNKAKLKYNSMIYLIDPEEIKSNQKNY